MGAEPAAGPVVANPSSAGGDAEDPGRIGGSQFVDGDQFDDRALRLRQ